MAKFVKGDVVVIPFPFSDLTQSKRRPALVITALDGDDLVLCQITSQTSKDKYAISVNDDDFETGAGRLFDWVRSENGKGITTTSPFTNFAMLHLPRF